MLIFLVITFLDNYQINTMSGEFAFVYLLRTIYYNLTIITIENKYKKGFIPATAVLHQNYDDSK